MASTRRASSIGRLSTAGGFFKGWFATQLLQQLPRHVPHSRHGFRPYAPGCEWYGSDRLPARVIAWRIHHVAYVQNLNPRRYSNLSTARIKPAFPSWIRSRKLKPRLRYFLAIDTTSASCLGKLLLGALVLVENLRNHGDTGSQAGRRFLSRDQDRRYFWSCRYAEQRRHGHRPSVDL